MVTLADLTTLHIGPKPRTLIVARSEQALIDTVRTADEAGQRIVVLGGGSNVLFTGNFRGDVVRVAHTGIENDTSMCAGAWVTVQAGTAWDTFVAQAVASGWTGLEALSGIPGTVGAAPIQNIGAYGQQVSDTIAQVRVWNRRVDRIETLFASDCRFDYRTSIFKQDPGAYVILSVTFQLKLGTLAAPVQWDELATQLGVARGMRVTMSQVRDAVLVLRRGKGMVVDAHDHDTWSVGSFFLNPRVSHAPEGAPAWPQVDGSLKVSAAWLIENAGFAKGFGLNDRATLSTKHTLAITNRGNASSDDVLELAQHIKVGVAKKYGIELELEPQVIN